MTSKQEVEQPVYSGQSTSQHISDKLDGISIADIQTSIEERLQSIEKIQRSIEDHVREIRMIIVDYRDGSSR